MTTRTVAASIAALAVSFGLGYGAAQIVLTDEPDRPTVTAPTVDPFVGKSSEVDPTYRGLDGTVHKDCTVESANDGIWRSVVCPDTYGEFTDYGVPSADGSPSGEGSYHYKGVWHDTRKDTK